ncbi:hypothetical protein J2Y45_006842 [Dyadobacter sp. BE34]|uniref:Outer membrane protein beta-barrel domain-containing protein n=1 Tax=Dyadobacter fermentans TaxID=94254 RepID=A0ABU1R991_9BACT|nr:MULTISPECIES: hypothetical protein [Dyadobacter]MDR6809777.1 hypothetical protein [Dyadobacter fermentans]MDR7047508.1 hypothetical protein [Dyadobacter sp. BE242]MDR7201678.1 hypothetical protein [Dyadobacter sp. BE34]MDR7219548.1 hypothetical protein [Dyadobacter sp. BE31]MDR7267329.1 hypothetical protein [Dyadobacter sp. BE32]
METEEFDDEIRGKLLDVSLQKAKESEVDTIFRFVVGVEKDANRSSATFLFVYGLVATMLITSIGYIKYHRGDIKDKLTINLQEKRSKSSNRLKRNGQRLVSANSGFSTKISPLQTGPVATNTSIPVIEAKRIHFNNTTHRNPQSIALSLLNVSGPPTHTYQEAFANINFVPTWQWALNREFLPVGYDSNIDTQKHNALMLAFIPARQQPSNLVAVPAGYDSEQYHRDQTNHSFMSDSINIEENKDLFTPASEPNTVGEIPPADRYGEIVEPSKRVSSPNINVGIALDAIKEQIGSSLIAEISLGKKWSVQTGLNWTRVKGARYHTAEQFTQQTGVNFRNLYEPSVDKEIELLNIKQSYQILRVPIILTYRHRITSNWAFIVGAGTKFNVYSSGKTHYEFQKLNTSLGKKVHRSTVDGPVLNSVSAMAGVERTWNRIHVRVTPTLGCGLRTADYEKKDLSLGAKIQLLYSIN